LLTIAGIVESEAAPGPRPEWRSRPVTSWPTSASGPTGSQGSDEGGRIHHALALDEIRGPHAGGQGRVQLVRVGADDGSAATAYRPAAICRWMSRWCRASAGLNRIRIAPHSLAW